MPWSVCSYALALGVLLDAEMIWLRVVLFLMGVGTAWKTSVTLRPTARSRRWQGAMAGTFGVALLVHVAVQFPVRALDWPLPNIIGAAAACLVIITLTRSVQARVAASLRA